MREPERPGNRKGLSEFRNLFCELFVGVLGNKNLLENMDLIQNSRLLLMVRCIYTRLVGQMY